MISCASSQIPVCFASSACITWGSWRSLMWTRPLTLFYRSFVESVVIFFSICWYGSITVKPKKNSIWRLIWVSICITGSKQKGLDELYQKQMLRRVESILSDSTLQAEFQMLTSGSRFKLPKLRTNRYKHSFVPAAILLLNSKTQLIDLPFIDCLLFFIVFSHACKVGNLCIGCVIVCDLYYTICCTMNCPTGDK